MDPIALPGEIVYDSILQNKERTKNYWERLMLATETGGRKRTTSSASRGESVVEREIRAQRERERAVAREREAAAAAAAAAATAAAAAAAVGHPQVVLHAASPREDEAALASMPTTDEGNYSEYGSEEKDHSIDGNTSRVMTPEVGFSHQRSPSFESMSSGHSSGSEFGIRQRTTVKPLELAKDNDISTLIRNQKETPIEKEIRLAKEREEELKKEKRNSHNLIIMNASKGAGETELQQNCITSQPAKRVQKEMGADIEMEKESKIPPTKDVSVQTKENGKEQHSTLLNKCISMTNLSVQRDASDTPPSKMNGLMNGSSRNISSWTPPNTPATPKLFIPNRNQKGVMKRFLESRGKMVPTFTFASNTPNNSPVTPKSPEANEVKKIFIERNQEEKYEGTTVVTRRPKYISAEDKIQMELEEMKKREAELRKERARHFGRSQPNLQEIDIEDEEDEEVRLPTMGKLRTALSNPNLLDSKPTVQKVVPNKRRSALIDEWENRIRNEQ